MPNWFDIRNQTATAADVYIYDTIAPWGVSFAEFSQDLRALSGKEVTVHIHSDGGGVVEGLAIYDALRRHEGGLIVQIEGMAASIASIIAMAGKPVRMAENAWLMIHNPSGGTYGGSEDMRRMADVVDKMRASLVAIYVKRTGKSEDEIGEVMDAETWFTAAEAKAFGLVDEITDRLEIEAKFSPANKFRNTPTALVDNKQTNMPATPTIESLTTERDTALANLVTAQAQAKKNFSDLTAITAKHDALVVDLAARDETIVALNADLAEAKKVTATAVNAEAVRILASSGTLPVKLGADGVNSNSDSALYDQFKAASPAEAARLYSDPATASRIKAESARRLSTSNK